MRSSVVVLLLYTTCAAAVLTTKLLPLTPRLQWENNDGYCGETSVQETCLYFGCYASQAIIRNQLSRGELTLDIDGYGPGNIAAALQKLKLRSSWYDTDRNNDNVKTYLVWVKQQLLLSRVVLFAMYISTGDLIGYDHIVPLFGISTQTPTSAVYDYRDVITQHTLFDTAPVRRTFASLPGSRQSCRYMLEQGGCAPTERQWGTSIWGIVDPLAETRPVQIYLSRPDEPNTSEGEAAVNLGARVVVRGLTIGRTYLLLRYNNLATLPDSRFKTSLFSSKVVFKATAATYTHITVINSNSVAVFRCVLA